MSAHNETHGEHASVKDYLIVAAILTVITIVEVATYYEPLNQIPHFWLMVTLIVLSAAKFFIVVGYFMHLKYDHRIFRRLFLGPLAAMGGLFLALVLLFAYHGVKYYQ